MRVAVVAEVVGGEEAVGAVEADIQPRWTQMAGYRLTTRVAESFEG